MQKNVGGYDRSARFVLGPILIIVGAAAFVGIITLSTGTLGLVLAGVAVLVGAVLTVTATTQKCPLNATIGLDTYNHDATNQSSSDKTRPEIK
ncbi:DUF2892 domain-containing protein [Haloarcula sp. 1CSR25-25]|uniref:YgaP family membrane protein n=1 Tax=Haloarcula sp. 1CSR25-25 TaxID=2862545 RepID=UPI0028947D66|nr:DUF2892 domain-containing protein [Haloarcula sp. 1CSR25-25]MDT3436524.1 DUF2892 domain-containing protein [Haloarcula sp. 1CSR25-25]